MCKDHNNSITSTIIKNVYIAQENLKLGVNRIKLFPDPVNANSEKSKQMFDKHLIAYIGFYHPRTKTP